MGAQPRPGPRETEALIKRYLAAQPDVSSRSADEGAVFLTQVEDARTVDGTRFFTIAADGGFLVRLRPEDQERHAERQQVGRNAALPAWVHALAESFAASPLHDPAQVRGAPREWLWIPLDDEASFNKRKPIVLQALDHARHLLSASGT